MEMNLVKFPAGSWLPEMEAEIRIDNSKVELDSLLGEMSLHCELSPVDFPDGQTMEQFWMQAGPGKYLLLTKSAHPRSDGKPSVHVTVLRDGSLRKVSTALLKTKLLAVQQVLSTSRSEVN